MIPGALSMEENSGEMLSRRLMVSFDIEENVLHRGYFRGNYFTLRNHFLDHFLVFGLILKVGDML